MDNRTDRRHHAELAKRALAALVRLRRTIRKFLARIIDPSVIVGARTALPVLLQVIVYTCNSLLSSLLNFQGSTRNICLCSGDKIGTHAHILSLGVD